MATSSNPCALNANGSLKDAADIEWFHDPDNGAPLAFTTTVTKSWSIEDFFSCPPTKKVGGYHQYNHIHKPATRTIDPDNIEAAGPMNSGSSGNKLKAADTVNTHSVSCCISKSNTGNKDTGNKGNVSDVESSYFRSKAGESGEETESCLDNGENDKGIAMAKYELLKSLGDTDHNVCTVHP